MSRRSFTLVEAVASLALLGVLAVAGARWLALVASEIEPLGERAAWEQAAQALVRQVHIDLWSFDAPAGAEPAVPSIRADHLTLASRARRGSPAGAGAVRSITYRFDPGRAEVHREVEGSASPPVLGEVERWSVELDGGLLRLGIASTHGQEVVRWLHLP